jgi:hypothetical protein
MAQAE